MVFAILLSIFSISSSYTVLANEKLDDPIEMFEALVI